jgi:hypothetical protein
LLPLGISSFRGSLAKEKSKSVAKALKICRRSRPIGSCESKLDAFKILLDNRNEIPEFGEEEA